MLINDVLSPQERIREYLDLELCMRRMADSLVKYPSEFPGGITVQDPNMNFKLTMLCDSEGVYGYVDSDAGRKGLKNLDEIIGVSQLQYICQPGAIRLLANAVKKLGKKRTFIVDGKELVITPLGGDRVNVHVNHPRLKSRACEKIHLRTKP